jgi:hypothetical protein
MRYVDLSIGNSLTISSSVVVKSWGAASADVC